MKVAFIVTEDVDNWVYHAMYDINDICNLWLHDRLVKSDLALTNAEHVEYCLESFLAEEHDIRLSHFVILDTDNMSDEFLINFGENQERMYGCMGCNLYKAMESGGYTTLPNIKDYFREICDSIKIKRQVTITMGERTLTYDPEEV